jgi:GNAT superfamily N-acetyltransferase
METVKLRQYRPSNHDRVLQLHYQGLKQVGIRLDDDFHSEYDADLTRIKAEYLQNGDFLIATIGEKTVGMGAIRRIDKRTAEIKRMRVDPEFQGRGIGSLILDGLIAEAKAAGYGRLILDTTDRMVVARRLYESCGFKEYQQSVFDGLTVIFYEMILGPKNNDELR